MDGCMYGWIVVHRRVIRPDRHYLWHIFSRVEALTKKIMGGRCWSDCSSKSLRDFCDFHGELLYVSISHVLLWDIPKIYK